MRSRKGSLNITINAIVIIVLALTFLSLGLVFIRGTFESFGDTTFAVNDQISEQIFQDLRRTSEKLGFPTSEVKVGRGDEEIVGVGIRNNLEGLSDFTVYILNVGEDGAAITSGTQLGSAFGGVTFLWDDTPQSIAVGEVGVIGIKVIGPSEGAAGTHIFKIAVYSGDNDPQSDDPVYASKPFFVKVTG